MCVMESPTQKYGYLDVKQSAKVKGRKLKNWRRRWVVLTKMTDMSSDQVVAKIDLYENETVWLTNRLEKVTFVFDHVTAIQKTNSRTHPHAFEVTQKHPELVFSGNSEIDSFGWMLTLQQIFTPHLVEMKKDPYRVTIQPNTDASRWNLSGEYSLAVSPACVSLNDLQTGNNLISWGLSTLMRFNVTRNPQSGDSNVLVIECGKTGPTGESKFGFISNEASDILRGIRQSICLALAQRQNARSINVIPRNRSTSETSSEKQFQNILDSSPFYPDFQGRDRSGSESSGCALTPVSPFPPTKGIDNPLLMSPDLCHGLTARRSNTELTSLNESDENGCENNIDQSLMISEQHRPKVEKDKVRQHLRHLSLPEKVRVRAKGDDPGYAVIKDVDKSLEVVDTRSRRNTIATDDAPKSSLPPEEPPIRPPPRRRRTSAINMNISKQGVSFEKEEDSRSDVDSAISSSLLSSSFDSAKLQAENIRNIEKSLARRTSEIEDFDMGSPSPPSSGLLDRRRSSSTPDLAAFWKHEASLENVYEELDSIRSAAPRKLPSSPTDIPPALPARPFNLLVPTFRNKNNQTVVRLKKSFFFNKPKMQRGKSMLSVEEPRACFCRYPYISSGGLLLSNGNDSMCGQCGGSINTIQSDDADTKSNTKFNVLSSSNSSLNDIYSSISDIKEKITKRRRSSEITRPSFVRGKEVRSQTLEIDPTKFYSLRRRDPQKLRNFQDLINNGSDETIGDFRDQGTSRLSTGSKDDPLVSFFMDDDNFKSNPMVTGRLAGSQHLHPPADDLLISPDSPRDVAKKDYFTEDIFMMEPDISENDDILKPKTVGSLSPLSTNQTRNDSTMFNPFTAHPDPLSSPVTYTCLQNPTVNPVSPFLTSSSSNPNWSNINPFQRTSSENSCHILTPSPLPSSNGVQFSNNNNCKTSPQESIYFSMQETMSKDSPSRTLASISNKVPGFKEMNLSPLNLFNSQSSENCINWIHFGDENKTPDVNCLSTTVADNEDLYMVPTGVQH